MDKALLQQRAERISLRVDAGKVGLDPASIIAILTSVIPLILRCFQKEEPTPEQVTAAVRRQHERNPVALRKRTMRRVRAEADEPLTKEQAFALGDAIIDEALDADSDEVAELCRVCTAPGDE